MANAGGMAGDRTMSHASHVPEDDFRANLDRNLMGTVFCCQAASVTNGMNGCNSRSIRSST